MRADRTTTHSDDGRRAAFERLIRLLLHSEAAGRVVRAEADVEHVRGLHELGPEMRICLTSRRKKLTEDC